MQPLVYLLGNEREKEGERDACARGEREWWGGKRS